MCYLGGKVNVCTEAFNLSYIVVVLMLYYWTNSSFFFYKLDALLQAL